MYIHIIISHNLMIYVYIYVYYICCAPRTSFHYPSRTSFRHPSRTFLPSPVTNLPSITRNEPSFVESPMVPRWGRHPCHRQLREVRNGWQKEGSGPGWRGGGGVAGWLVEFFGFDRTYTKDVRRNHTKCGNRSEIAPMT